MKLKTVKAVAKRFKITKKGALRHKTAGQDHFNAGERSKVTRAKRKEGGLIPAYVKGIKKMMPHY